MNKKVFSLLIAIAMVVSMLTGAISVPRAQAVAPTYTSYRLGSDSTGGASTWDPTAPKVGKYSVKLTQGLTDASTYVTFVPDEGVTLADLTSIAASPEWSFWYKFAATTANQMGPQLELDFTPATGNGHVEVTLMPLQNYNPPNTDWHKYNVTSTSTRVVYYGKKADGLADLNWDNTSNYSLATAETAIITAEPAASTWELTGVRMELWNANNGQVVNIDDVTINGTTYALEPIILDTAYYNDTDYFCKTGDTIGIIVPLYALNTDHVRVETIKVDVISTTDTVGLKDVVLTETGFNTGIFTGSIATTGTVPPPAGTLAVSNGDTISVSTQTTYTVTATVDDTKPAFGAVSPLDAATVYDTTPTITANYSDGSSGINTDSVVMKVNGVAVTPDSVTDTIVSYTPTVAFAPGSTVAVTVDVSDNAGNAAVTKSWSFTIAEAFNVAITAPSPATMQAASATTVTVTYKGVDNTGIHSSAADGQLKKVTTTLSGPGVSASFDDTADTSFTHTFSGVTAEQAGTITVTFVGTFKAVAPSTTDTTITKTLTIDVTGFLVTESWADVEINSTHDISMTVTTKAGAPVNTGYVVITAPVASGFQKDVDPTTPGLESFTTIEINGTTGKITYGTANPENFVVNNGIYTVTGIKFVQLGDVKVTVEESSSGTTQAEFPEAFTVIGNNVYTLAFSPTKLTAGIDLDALDITITEAGVPVTDVTKIYVDDVEYTGVITHVTGTNVYTIDPANYTTAQTVVIKATNAGATKYGTANLSVELPTVTFVIKEQVGTPVVEVVRNVMLKDTTSDYKVYITAKDALGNLITTGSVWIGTYGGTPTPSFTSKTTTTITDGAATFTVTNCDWDAGTYVWKVGNDTEVKAALLLTPELKVEAPAYTLTWVPTTLVVGTEGTFTVKNNYGEPTSGVSITIVTPVGDIVYKTTIADGTFKYTPPIVGDYTVTSSRAITPASFPVVNAVVDIAAIPGVTAPVVGATPVAAITATAQYTGTVAWSPADATFAASTVYTATITLTAKPGFTFTGVTANFFTVAGATATNLADSGVVTAVFPITPPPAPKYIKILTPMQNDSYQPNGTITVTWDVNGFGAEALQGMKIRVLFFNDVNSPNMWATVAYNLPIQNDSVTINLSQFTIADPLRCKVRVGIYIPDSVGSKDGIWDTWQNGIYTATWIAESGYFWVVNP